MKRLVSGLAALAILMAPPLFARPRPADNPDVVALSAAPVALRSEFAYVLVRISHVKMGLWTIEHALLRVPTAQEMNEYREARAAAYAKALPTLARDAKSGAVPAIDDFRFAYPGRPNLFVVDPSTYLQDGPLRTVLMQVPAGKYVVYGLHANKSGLKTCNCLGTVSFVAKPGVITDIGSLYADIVEKPSSFPQLESGVGGHIGNYGAYLGQALVPVGPNDPVPAALKGLPIAPASFEVVGEFYEPGASDINRLAPIPGLLAYDRGRPYDVRKGK